MKKAPEKIKNRKKQTFHPSTQRIFHPSNPTYPCLLTFAGIGILGLAYFLQHENAQRSVHAHFWAGIGALTRPVAALQEKAHNAADLVKSRRALEQENALLRKKVRAYEAQYFDYAKLQEENTYLRRLHTIAERISPPYITVLRRPAPDQPFVVLTSPPPEVYAAVATGDAVISPEGLVGVVHGKAHGTITVHLAPHVRSRIPVVGSKSRRRALLCGQNSPFFCIKYIATTPAQSGPYTVPSAKEEAPFEEGEFLETDTSSGPWHRPIRVAQIVRNGDKLRARWVASEQETYMTILLESNH